MKTYRLNVKVDTSIEIIDDLVPPFVRQRKPHSTNSQSQIISPEVIDAKTLALPNGTTMRTVPTKSVYTVLDDEKSEKSKDISPTDEG